jgi:Spy/CpxP family protein refolding chaperone
MMVRQLDLSEQQREQVRAIMDEQRQSDPGAGVREAEQKLHAALLSDSPDVAAIESLKSTLNAAHAAELDRQVAAMLKVAQVLTPAQRQQLQKLAPPAGRRGR